MHALGFGVGAHDLLLGQSDLLLPAPAVLRDEAVDLQRQQVRHRHHKNRRQQYNHSTVDFVSDIS